MYLEQYVCLLSGCILIHMSHPSPIDLHLMALLPMNRTSTSDASGRSTVVYLEMALENVNGREDILPGYKLNLHRGRSECSVGVAMNSLYEMLYSPPTKIMLLGEVCSHVCLAAADASTFWNITQVAFGCGSPNLSNREKYPRFFRTIPDYTDIVEIHFALLKMFNWKKFATVHEPKDLFSAVTARLVQMVGGQHFDVLTSEVFYDHPRLQVQNLKKHDARIIFINTYEYKALMIFCEAYKQGLYGGHIQWIAVSFYINTWWKNGGADINCTTAQILEAVQHVMYVGLTYQHPVDKNMVSGLSRNEVLPAFNERTNYTDLPGTEFLGMSYDAPWAVALALNITQTKLRLSGSTKKLEDFAYNDTDLANLLTESMREVKFTGLLGEQSFVNNDKLVAYGIYQQIGTERRFVGWYADGVMHEVNGGVQWKDGSPPSDSSVTIYKKVYVSTTMYILLCSISGAGMLLSLFLLVFNIVCSQKRVVKMSSPKINNLILVGCLLAYTEVFFQDIAENNGHALAFCVCRNFLFIIGFCLAYGALFSKTWRIHVILTRSKSLLQVKIRDSQLVSVVFGLVLVETLVLIIWQAVDPLQLIIENLPPQEMRRNEITVYQVARCQSNYEVYFTGSIYVIQGIMMAFGAFLAWETRKVEVEALNDSKLIGVCIYNVLILSVLGVAINRAVDDVDTAYGFSAGFIITGTTLTQCIIFIPKVLAVKRNDELIMPLGSLGNKPTNDPGTSTTSSLRRKPISPTPGEKLQPRSQC